MKFAEKILIGVCVVVAVSGCTSSYPYIVMNDNCRCKDFVYREKRYGVILEFSARYSIDDRITSTIKLTIKNEGDDTLSLKQAVAKVTSNNISYRYNGIFLPMPYVDILPGRHYSMEMSGSDTRTFQHPLEEIPGERMTIVLKGLTANLKAMDSVVVDFQPVDPKFAS